VREQLGLTVPRRRDELQDAAAVIRQARDLLDALVADRPLDDPARRAVGEAAGRLQVRYQYGTAEIGRLNAQRPALSVVAADTCQHPSAD
jgi:hypothetical protein